MPESHYPECLSANPTLRKAEAPMYGLLCICDELRACEQRILLSKPNIELSAVYGYEAGRVDGLNAAREAVATQYRSKDNNTNYRDEDWDNAIDDALAAIDALKEKP